MGNVRIDGLKVVSGNPNTGENPNTPNGQGNGGNSGNAIPQEILKLRFVMVDEDGDLVPGQLIKTVLKDWPDWPPSSGNGCVDDSYINAANIWFRPNQSSETGGDTYYLDDSNPNGCPDLSLPNNLFVGNNLTVDGTTTFNGGVNFHGGININSINVDKVKTNHFETAHSDYTEFQFRRAGYNNTYFFIGVSREGDQYADLGVKTSAGDWKTLVLNRTGEAPVLIGGLCGGNMPDNTKLGVDGNIAAREITVDNDNWCDYVFKDDYKLRTLSELDTYIKQEGHLPEIPTTAEVEENGVALGEMNALLLKKIEELTLYTLQQQKEIDELKRIVNK